jgi:hypothetical protein
MTYRDRREARAENLRAWAEKRTERAAAVFEANEPYTSDYAFNTQPGHIPARARIIAQEDRAHESLRKARDMASRADEIERQAERAIYDDDPDAVERLTERLAELEAERDRIKRYNASCRKGARDFSILTADERADLASTAKAAPYMIGKKGEMPAYKLRNLTGNIKRNRDRLEVVKKRQARTEAAEATGVLVEHLGTYARVTFAAKPDRDTLDALKAAGYRWGQGSWTGKADQLPAEVSE